MSTLQAGRSQGFWGADWRVYVIVTLALPLYAAVDAWRWLKARPWIF
jgi:hypothetical protein